MAESCTCSPARISRPMTCDIQAVVAVRIAYDDCYPPPPPTPTRLALEHCRLTGNLPRPLNPLPTPSQVKGDVFIGRIFDNEDDFKRLDFSMSDLSSSAPWVGEAKQQAQRNRDRGDVSTQWQFLQQNRQQQQPSARWVAAQDGGGRARALRRATDVKLPEVHVCAVVPLTLHPLPLPPAQQQQPALLGMGPISTPPIPFHLFLLHSTTTQVVELTPAESQKEAGNAAFKAGKWVEAVEHYTAAIKLDSTLTSALNNRYAGLVFWWRAMGCDLYLGLGMPPAAAACAWAPSIHAAKRSAIKRIPGAAAFYTLGPPACHLPPPCRAMAYLKLSRLQEAAADCSAVLALEPTNVKALLRRATAQEGLDQPNEALRDAEAVLALQPLNKEAAALKAKLEAAGAASQSAEEVQPAAAATSAAMEV